MSQETLQTVFAVLGLVGGAISWLYQIRTKSRRDKIKLDLEILEKANLLLGDADPRSVRVRASIERRMDEVYAARSGKAGPAIAWPDLVLFGFCACGVAVFARDGVAASEGWELALAGVLAFIGAGALMNAFDRKRDQA